MGRKRRFSNVASRRRASSIVRCGWIQNRMYKHFSGFLPEMQNLEILDGIRGLQALLSSRAALTIMNAWHDSCCSLMNVRRLDGQLNRNIRLFAVQMVVALSAYRRTARLGRRALRGEKQIPRYARDDIARSGMTREKL